MQKNHARKNDKINNIIGYVFFAFLIVWFIASSIDVMIEGTNAAWNIYNVLAYITRDIPVLFP